MVKVLRDLKSKDIQSLLPRNRSLDLPVDSRDKIKNRFLFCFLSELCSRFALCSSCTPLPGESMCQACINWTHATENATSLTPWPLATNALPLAKVTKCHQLLDVVAVPGDLGTAFCRCFYDSRGPRLVFSMFFGPSAIVDHSKAFHFCWYLPTQSFLPS